MDRRDPPDWRDVLTLVLAELDERVRAFWDRTWWKAFARHAGRQVERLPVSGPPLGRSAAAITGYRSRSVSIDER